MSSCAIMQPTYLPWSGYFNLMSRVDKFIFLDDVQFQKSTWHARNRILLNGNEHLLTIPTKKTSLQTKICDVTIPDNNPWQKKHWKTIVAAYEKATYGRELLDLLSPLFTETRPDFLGEWTIGIISLIADYLQIGCEIHKASELACGGRRSDHVLQICNSLSCDHYLSPAGAIDYLKEDGFDENKNVSLEIQVFTPAKYHQLGRTEYLSHLSVIDVIANCGQKNSARYIRGDYS